MKKIGFKNFRRFKILEPVEFKGINFLVGRNNSGKSTISKAMKLMTKYLKSDSIDKIKFGNKANEDSNLVTYGRSLHHSGDSKKDDNFIEFNLSILDFDFTIKITSDHHQNSIADVLSLKVFDNVLKLQYVFQKGLMTVKKSEEVILNEKVNIVREVEQEIYTLKQNLEGNEYKKSDPRYIEAIDEINKLKLKIQNIISYEREDSLDYGEDAILLEKEATYSSSTVDSDEGFELSLEYDDNIHFIDVIKDFIEIKTEEYKEDSNANYKNEETSHEYKYLRYFYEIRNKIESRIDLLHDYIFSTYSMYMGAHPQKQASLISIHDSSNGLAMAIKEFMELSLDKGDYEYQFIEKWMREFEVGDDFEITSYEGEYYRVNIISDEGVKINLADKGTGSIQAMYIIIKIASIIGYVRFHKINLNVLIEEPELGLHPALQSKLCDFFLEVHKLNKDKISFIIETHSEYLIRRSQVIVAEKNYATYLGDNPFSVLYFYKSNKNVDVFKYEEDGTFDKDFGPGFLDEASSSTMQLLRLKRKKRKENNEDLRK